MRKPTNRPVKAIYVTYLTRDFICDPPFFYFIIIFFLQHDTYINYIKVPLTRLSTYIALHYLLTVHLRYNWYLCFLHCSTYTTYNVIMQTYLEAHHLHTHTQKEKLIHKKLTVTKNKKAKLWVRLIRVRAWKENTQKYNVIKNWFSEA